MLNKNNKKKILALFLFSMIFLTVLVQNNLILNWNNDTNLDKKLSSDEQTDLGNIKANEVLTDEIRINASATGLGAHNWTWAAAQDWCSGSGTIGDPYIIANLEIDGQNLHSGIIIENSYNWMSLEYFRIENNIIYNIGGSDSGSAGIKIYKSRYGTIRNNNISSSRDGNYGIHVIGDGPWGTNPSEYINITENYITNTERGIHLEEGCREMIISENVAKFNSIAGIYIAKECKRITVSNNILSENEVFGIADTGTNIMMWMPDDGNTIFNNTIINNAYGFYLARTVYDKISYNNISSNSIHGLYVSGSSENTITNNTFSNNVDKGILMVMGPGGSRRNKIYRNDFIGNGEHAVEDTNIPWTMDYNNWSWWEGMPGIYPIIGNYWDNYTGADTDDDGVGDTPHIFEGNQDNFPYWNDGIEGHVIFINGSAITPYNWTWARGRFWCTGTGMMGDPYVIGPNEDWDGVIDAWNKPVAITIVDTDFATHFRIEGNTIINSSQAGIKLINTETGAIHDNIISSNGGHGIHFDHGHSINITENIINGNSQRGIFLDNQGPLGPFMYGSHNNFISGNTISNNEYGIYLRNKSIQNNITSNIISNNNQYGIYIADTTSNQTAAYHNEFINNNIHAYDIWGNNRWNDWNGRGNYWDNYIGLGGLDDDDDGIGDIPYDVNPAPLIQDIFPICDDGLQEYPLFINDTFGAWNNWEWASKKLFVSGSGTQWNPYVIENVSFNGNNNESPIRIIHSQAGFKYFRIENCTLYNIGGPDSGKAGIYLEDTKYGEIINNTFLTNNAGNYGIHLTDYCGKINITDNTIDGFKYGIYLEYWSSNMMSDPNIFSGNIIKNNIIGIFIDDNSQFTNITDNDIIDNSYIGIYLTNNSGTNKIYRNNIMTNGIGIKLNNSCSANDIVDNDIKDNAHYGLHINSSGNTIYNNDFTTTTGWNAHDDTPFGGNTWYSMMNWRGNYWSNYTPLLYSVDAKDEDDDGIGDIRYNLTGIAKAQDWYPIYDDGHNGSKIEIDGSLAWGMPKSWGWAAGRIWCSGSGIENDPFVIENLKIDAWRNGSCIYIHDSVGVIFRIQNSTFYNSSATTFPDPAGGIRLVRVTNGTIINNTIYNNDGHGIVVESTQWDKPSTGITIQNNIIKNNNGSGVYVNGTFCFDNLIFNNSISSNGDHGIVISDYAYRNDIINNYLYDNEATGVFIEEGGWWGNFIINNTIISGRIGIGIDGRETVDISYNNISDTTSHGIAIQYSNPMMMMDIHDINITGNIIHNCGDDGISFGWNNSQHSFNNRITENYIYNNTDAGISLQECDNSIIAKNTLDNNYVGIALEFLSSFNEFRDNIIINSGDQGLAIFDLDSIENKIYGNNFTGNGLNGFDFGLDNHWYWMNTGNYWDDYQGNDTNDDGIGDTPYNVNGLTNPKDMFPEWWDAPVLLKVFPLDNAEFAADISPAYEIQITQGKGHTFWYEIVGTGTTSPYMPLLGNPDEIISGKILSSLWSPLAGATYTLRFHVNDSQGLPTTQDVSITKLNTTSTTAPAASSGGSSSSSTDDAVEEEGYPWYIQAAMTGAVSATAGLIIKQVYSSAKKRRLILEKIHENFAKVENLERFLKDNLDYEAWQRFEEPWKQYQSEEITERKFIKKAKKSLGKRFTELFIPHKKSRRRTTT